MRIFRFLSAAVSITAIAAAFAAPAMSAPITYGNIVVTRVGDGLAALSNTGTAVFLDEYTTSGALVQSIAVPTAASGSNLSLVGSGTATSDLGLQESGNNRYLTFGGYNAAVGTAGVANSSVQRVAARVDILTGTVDTSTTFGATGTGSGGNIRNVYSQDGTSFYAASGSIGAMYTTYGTVTDGTQLTTSITSGRRVTIYNGQLYLSSGSGTNTFKGVDTIGTGTPTTAGQPATRLTGFTDAAAASSYDFVFANTTTLYVADDSTGATAGGGVQKWSLVNGTWTKQYTGTFGTSLGIRGVSVDFFNPNNLYGISQSGTDLLKLVDTGSGFTVTSIASAGTNTLFRGVAVIVPEANTAALAALALPLLAGAAVIRRRRK